MESKSLLKRDDYVRLLLQALNDLGFSKTAEALVQESNVTLQSDSISQFCESVLAGNWALVETLLNGLELKTADDLLSAKFLIYEQKYLELLEQSNVTEALECMRTCLTPLKKDYNRVHRLTSLLMCTDIEEVKRKAAWDGSAGKSRARLLEKLRRYISAHSLLPERRLESLVLQAIDLQKRECIYHNITDDSTLSLFEDHICSSEQIPSKTRHILQAHTDEIWFIQYSHNGKYLASASKDKTIIIWSLEKSGEAKALHILAGHVKEPSYLSWSPSDDMLLSAGSDNLLKLWDSESGVCLHTYSKHTKPVTACAWLPDNKHFVSGGLDVKIHMWNINGDLIRTWTWNKTQINDMVVSPNGRWLAVVGQEKLIRLYDLIQDNPEDDESLPERAAITSLSFSKDSRYLLVNVTATGIQEIHLWDINTRELVKKYSGHQQGRFVIRSCFGGAHQAFILSGSEDYSVYIWNRSHEQLLFALPGHAGTVNSVAWNPVNPYQFASASDDQTIRIWESDFADEFRSRMQEREEKENELSAKHKKRRRKGNHHQNGSAEENGYDEEEEEEEEEEEGERAGKGKEKVEEKEQEREKEKEKEEPAIVADGHKNT